MPPTWLNMKLFSTSKRKEKCCWLKYALYYLLTYYIVCLWKVIYTYPYMYNFLKTKHSRETWFIAICERKRIKWSDGLSSCNRLQMCIYCISLLLVIWFYNPFGLTLKWLKNVTPLESSYLHSWRHWCMCYNYDTAASLHQSSDFKMLLALR